MGVPIVSEFYLRAFFVLTTIIYFTTTSESPLETDRGKVEELFKKIHPNLATLDSAAWDLADKITESKLEKACRDVEVAVNPSKLTSYVLPTRDKPLKEQRVILRAPVLFTTGDEGTKYAKLINCTFTELQFYLAQGSDDDHVFCLEKDSADEAFRFRSGLHEINKSGFAD